MAAFFLALFLGILEMVLLLRVIRAILTSHALRAVLFLTLKLIAYACGLLLLFTLWKAQLIAGAIGFGIGLPVAAIVYTLISLGRQKKSGSDKGDGTI